MKLPGRESQQLEGFIIKQLLTASGAFKGTGEAGSGLTAELFAETLADAIAGSGHGLGLSELIDRSLQHGAPAESPFTRISSGFGARVDPLDGHAANHTGVDLPAAEGTPVPVVGDGVVIAAGERGGYGNAIEVRHGDGSSTLYAHLSGVAVAPGDRVRAGETVGFVGQTGRSTGPHLHLELRREGHPVDPGLALKAYGLRAERKGGGSP
ncbi:MAG: M23 family metallopeptidase [Myxococcota bacterium]